CRLENRDTHHTGRAGWACAVPGPASESSCAGAFLFSLLRALIIVVIARDVVLLPVAKSHFQHAHFRASAAQAMAGLCRNPDMLTGFWLACLIPYLHQRARIQHNP